jgi:hypothetical protein
MEEDGTPDSAAKSAYRELAKQLKAELEKVIREMRQPTPEDIAALTGRVKDKVIATATRKTLESFGLFGMADPDDYIGTDYRLWTYEEIQKAGGPGIPFTMTLKKSGCRYVVEGRVQAD